MMKQVFVFVVVLGIFGSLCKAEIDEEFIQNVMKKMQQIGEECIKETGASDDDVGALLQKKTPTTKEGKCLVSCFGVHLGIQDKDGKYSAEGVKAAFEPLKKAKEDLYDKVMKIFDECSKEVVISDDKCETATSYFECSIKKEKEQGLDNGPF